MKIIDDVVVNAKSVASDLGKKAGKVIDISKLRLSAADISAEINKKFRALGKLVFTAKREGADNETDIEDIMNEIEDLYDQLDAVNEQIVLMRHQKICPVCKKENPAEAEFCNACGSALDVVDEKEESKPVEDAPIDDDDSDDTTEE